MKINKFTMAFLFCSMVAFSSSYAMDGLENIEDTKSWLPPRLQDSVQEIEKRISQERLTKIQNNKDDWFHDYGFSFPGVNDVQKFCLIKICTLYSHQNSRPIVLDLGAGHGLMSWKMITAGGHVTAIEQQLPTAEALQVKVMEVKPFLAPNESVKTVCRLLKGGDVCDYTINIYKTFYDVTWSGNIIHLMTPNQAMAYAQNLYKITKPGGYAFASVHSPCGEESLLQSFLTRKMNNELFPGFFVMNRIHHYRHNAVRNVDECTQVERFALLDSAPSDMSPSTVVDGYYQDTSNPKFDFKHPHDGSMTYKMKIHSAAHFFDPESLSYFFKEAGFDIEEAFFIDKKGKRVQKDLSIEEMLKDKFGVGIIARKPESIEKK